MSTLLSFEKRRMAHYGFVRPLLHGKTVLEIGCADGVATMFLAEHAGSVLGVDWDAEVVARARGRYTRENLEFRVADPLWLTRSGVRFHVAIVPDADPLLREQGFLDEVVRVLRTDGLLYAVVRAPDDQGAGVDYDELRRLLSRRFAFTRLGVERPFVGIDFSDEAAGASASEIRLEGAEELEVSHYFVLAGIEPLPSLAHTLVAVQDPRPEDEEDQALTGDAQALERELRAAREELAAQRSRTVSSETRLRLLHETIRAVRAEAEAADLLAQEHKQRLARWERESLATTSRITAAEQGARDAREQLAQRAHRISELEAAVAELQGRAQAAEEETGRVLIHAAAEVRGLKDQLRTLREVPASRAPGGEIPAQTSIVRRMAATIERLRRERARAERRTIGRNSKGDT